MVAFACVAALESVEFVGACGVFALESTAFVGVLGEFGALAQGSTAYVGVFGLVVVLGNIVYVDRFVVALVENFVAEFRLVLGEKKKHWKLERLVEVGRK